MTKDILEEKLSVVLEPRPVYVERKVNLDKNGDIELGNYLTIIIELADGSIMLGFVNSDFEPDFEAILDQVLASESKCNPEATYILEGSTAIISDAFWFVTGQPKAKLTEISLPSSLVEICPDAFSFCEKLKNIVIPEGVIEIGNGAFENCFSLESVVLPQSLKKIGYYAFSGCNNLIKINIPQSIERIGENAFADCSIEELTFENAHILFENGLVINKDSKVVVSTYNCNITNVIIPDNVIRIGSIVFNGCTSIQKAILPQSLSQIEEYAFNECTSLQSIIIPSNVVKISPGVFRGCSSLMSVTLMESVTEIGKEAFSRCTSLKSLTLPKSIEKIGSEAFSYCSSLSEVTLLNPHISLNKTEWDSSAFKGCNNLRNVNLPKGLSWSKVRSRFKGTPYGEENPNPSPAIAKRERVKKLNAATIEMVVKTLTNDMEASVDQQDNKIIIIANLPNGSHLYAEVPKDKNAPANEINFDPIKAAIETAPDGALVIVGISKITYGMFDGNNDITTIIFPDNLSEIGSEAFAKCTSLKSVIIPEGVTKLGKGAFEDCTSLESVVLPESITKIEDSLFKGCKSLSYLSIPNPEKIESIKPEAFLRCNIKDLTLENDHWLLNEGLVINKDEKEIIGTYRTDLEKVIVPEWVIKIGDGAFAQCKSIKSILFPQSLKDIGSNAFEGCSSLKSITIPSLVTSIGEETFLECSSLEEVWLPGSVIEIGNKAFSGCTSLHSISLPQKIQSIGEYAFSCCSELKNVTLPEGLLKMEDYAFCKCSSLESIVIPQSVTQIGSFAFSKCTSLRNITFPDNLKEIEWGTFEGCTSLKSISLPKFLKEISSRAFYKSGLVTVTIPTNIQYIADEAFGNCESLTQVSILGNIPLQYWDNIAFSGCKALTKVNLPNGLSWENVRGKFRHTPYGQRRPEN